MISLYPLGPLLHHDLHGTRVTQPVAGDQRILDMLVKAVMFKVRYPGDAALRIFGIGLIGTGLGDHQDLLFRMMLGDFEGIAQTGNPRTNDKEICLYHTCKVSAGSLIGNRILKLLGMIEGIDQVELHGNGLLIIR